MIGHHAGNSGETSRMSQAYSAALSPVNGFIYQDAFRNSNGPRGTSHTPVDGWQRGVQTKQLHYELEP